MTLQTAQARAEGMGQLWLYVTVADATYGNPEFILGGVGFISTNVHGGPPVNPVVLSWGSFQGGMSSDISSEGGGQVILDGNAWLTPGTSTARLTVSSWLRETNWREAPAYLYQWNATESTQELVWKGYVIGVTGSRFSGGAYSVELMLSATLRDMETTHISDLVTKADFASAPMSKLGLMVPRVYGSANELLSTTDIGGGVGRVGLGLQGVPGVVIGENEATAKVKVRFAKNDGVSAWSSFPSGTGDDAGSYGGLWIYDSGAGCYGMVDPAAYTITNNSGYTEVVVDKTASVFFYVKPSQIGSANSAGFTDSNKIIDSDPNNYVTSDNVGNHSWSFYMPQVSFGGKIASVGVLADWQNAHASKNRQITIGVWDIYAGAFGGASTPAWLNNQYTQFPKASGDPRIISAIGTSAAWPAGRYYSGSFLGHTGDDTDGEMSGGTFITRNAANALTATLEARAFVEDLGGAHAGRGDVRLYNFAIILQVEYNVSDLWDPVKVLWNKWWSRHTLPHRQLMDQYTVENEISKKNQMDAATQRNNGVAWFARGGTQKDDGSGTYTGSAAAVIEKPQDIAHHILASVSGQTVNATAGTLGNFIDPRTNGVLKDIKILKAFGPEPTKRKEALEELSDRLPVRFRRAKAGVWHCIPDDMNPHSSRVYRSTSEPVYIGPNDIAADSFSDRELDASEFVNSVQLNYSHGYPNLGPTANTTYENHLSQKWFGKKATETYDYPELAQYDLSKSVDAAPTAVAQWLGRRTARPRRIVSCSLFQKFYDLSPGHVLGFQDLEDIGIPVQAYRAGLLDYYFNSSAGGTDYADSAATVLISLTSSACLIGLSQQTDAITFSVATAAAYTSVANQWRYSSASGFSNFSGITNTDGLKSTGTQTIGWTMPNWWEWIKSEQTLGGTTYGPCYWIEFVYSVPVTAGLANLRTTYVPSWQGRYFEVLTATRRPGRKSKDYPYMDAVLMEVM